MPPSAACLALIKRSESCELKAYLDTNQVPTIGYGHTGADIHLGMQWTQDQAEAAFAADVDEAAKGVLSLVSECNQSELDALTSFVFNLGRGALASSHLLQFHNQGFRSGAAAEFGKWIHSGQTIEPGLIVRRAREAIMYLGQQ